jgi:hypothetical protein
VPCRMARLVSNGSSVGISPPSASAGAWALPRLTSTILSPRSPSVSIRATESVRIRLWTRRTTVSSTRTFRSIDSGRRMAVTRPIGTPASRTVAPSIRPPTWANPAKTRYCRSNMPDCRPRK